MAALHRPALPLPRKLGVPGLGKVRSGRLLLWGAIALIVVLALLQVNQFSRLTSTGYQIDELNTQRAAREAENHDLAAQVAQLSSLARVDWEARVRLHMEPAQQTLYVAVNQPVPQQQLLPTRYLPPQGPPAAAPAGQRSLWKRALDLLPF
jgi:cell division protein FtsL